jgi:hypothetical protein
MRCGRLNRHDEANRSFSQLCKCFSSRRIMKFSYTISPAFDDSSRDMTLYVLKKKPARPSGPLVPVYQTMPWNTKEIPNLQNNFPEDHRDLTLACKRDLGCVVVAYDAVTWRVVTDAKGEHKPYCYLRLCSLSHRLKFSVSYADLTDSARRYEISSHFSAISRVATAVQATCNWNARHSDSSPHSDVPYVWFRSLFTS